MDLSNYTYAIIPLYKNNYTDINQIEAHAPQQISSNNHNSFEFYRITSEEIAQKYVKYYINLITNNPTKAYQMLDSEYREKRFQNNYNNFIYYRTQMLNNAKFDTEIKSEFISQGINQTLHRVYVNFNCDMAVVTPMKRYNQNVVNQFIIAEHVIVGNIPNAYYNLEGIEKPSNTINLMK